MNTPPLTSVEIAIQELRTQYQQQIDDLQAKNKELNRRNEAIKRHIVETCNEFKKTYKDNFGVLALVQKTEESLTWVNDYLKKE